MARRSSSLRSTISGLREPPKKTRISTWSAGRTMVEFCRTPGDGVDGTFFAAGNDDAKAVEWVADLTAAEAQGDCAGADIANGGEKSGGIGGKVREQSQR